MNSQFKLAQNETDFTLMAQPPLTIYAIKKLGKEKSNESLQKLLEFFFQDLSVDLKREIVSSIGRQKNLDVIYDFLQIQAFNNHPMELVYQMYRTCLYKSKIDTRFIKLGKKIRTTYQNEVIDKMHDYYKYRQERICKQKQERHITKPLVLVGDSEKTIKTLPKGSIQLIFTSPPYYNAREYSDYHSYKEYLNKMQKILVSCHYALEDGRFIIINVSPIITKRAGREFESIRYPIHFDFHNILTESGFYFIDEIIWIKPESSVPNRNGGYQQTRKPLTYKPNCITESLLVYRKNVPFLLDKNINQYDITYERFENEKIDTNNCWYISPTFNKNHPAVFPEELCRRVLKYYSFKNDIVLDPFAGSGTFGKVAKQMKRIPILCEMNEEYVNLIQRGPINYEIRK